jgi:hypothetical protein
VLLVAVVGEVEVVLFVGAGAVVAVELLVVCEVEVSTLLAGVCFDTCFSVRLLLFSLFFELFVGCGATSTTSTASVTTSLVLFGS